ncbi:MAG: hypothetical protein IAG13_25845, partial [Deltaproteobacteria bacterium]|nr:hypothetical protein [Nannocystaceae bacterium]
LLLVAACGDDADPSDGGASSPSDTSAGDPSTAGDPSSVGDPSSASVDTSAGESGSGELGPTARVRVINLVEGLEFTAWGADTNFDPVVIADGLTYASVSEYFDAPLNELSMEPQIVLVPAGEPVENTSTWQIDNSQGLDRAFVTFRELEGAGQQGTIVLTADAQTGNLQWAQLDESELMLGDAGMTTLHVSWNLFDLEGGVVPAFAVVGEPCLFTSSTGLAEPWSVAPGTFEVGIYDRQMVSECSVLLGSTEITAAADEHVLVAVYHEGDTVKLFSAPVPQ